MQVLAEGWVVGLRVTRLPLVRSVAMSRNMIPQAWLRESAPRWGFKGRSVVASIHRGRTGMRLPIIGAPLLWIFREPQSPCGITSSLIIKASPVLMFDLDNVPEEIKLAKAMMGFQRCTRHFSRTVWSWSVVVV